MELLSEIQRVEDEITSEVKEI